MRWNLFKRKKKEAEDPFGTQSQVQKESRKTRSVSWSRFSNPFSKRYRIGFLLKVKRVIAGLLLIVNVITAFMAIENTASFFFLLTAFILLDYLWKTRKKAIHFE